MIDHTTAAPVHKSVTVQTGVEHAFHVFTAGFHTWWPKSHHTGKSPMKTAVVEGRVGGECYTEGEDGSKCHWGSVLAWDPPHRVVFSWQLTAQWQFEADLARSSEVEITFTPIEGGATRVNLEHRHLERHGAEALAIRKNIDSPGGWGSLLDLYATEANR
jgi:uncharacterized protein YndB with AHSA1/START domain